MGLQGSLTLALFLLVGMCTADVPDDNLAIWPSPAQLNILAQNLTGTILFPKSIAYQNQSTMENLRFNSKFGIIVMAETTEDVQQAILFCKEYGIRPTIKSSGHEYVGRSSGDHTVSINLTRMKKIQVQNDPRSESGVSGIIGPGNAWGDVYRAVDGYGYLIVGGSCPSVSPSGFTLGGGQSPLSRKFGLAVDNVIELTLVTPDGSVITLTKEGNGTIQYPHSSLVEPYQDPELFWALRGGGGGVFGVVTSFTFQLHKPPEDGFCYYSAMYPMDLGGEKVGKDVLKVFSPYFLHNMTGNWGGHVIFDSNTTGYNRYNQAAYPSFKGFVLLALLHIGACEGAQRDLNFLFDIYPNKAFFRQKKEYETFLDYIKESDIESDMRTYVINRLLQPADLENPDKMATVLSDMTDNEAGVGGVWRLLGGKVTEMPAASAAVSGLARTALGALTLSVSWMSEAYDDFYIPAMRRYGEKMYTIGNGTYYNEPDQFLENWEEEFWGLDIYNRLLAVKQRIDKDEMFWCLNCVGSELRDAKPRDLHQRDPQPREPHTKSAAEVVNPVLHAFLSVVGPHGSSAAGGVAPVAYGLLPAIILSCLYMLNV